MSEMKKRRPFGWTELSRELKRRHVYTVVATYAVVSWILLQIGEVTFAPLHLPEWVMSHATRVPVLATRQDELFFQETSPIDGWLRWGNCES